MEVDLAIALREQLRGLAGLAGCIRGWAPLG